MVGIESIAARWGGGVVSRGGLVGAPRAARDGAAPPRIAANSRFGARGRGPRGGWPGTSEGQFAIALARAFGGATVFALPLLMTMEMWYLGFSMDRLRLALLLMALLPLLGGLSYYAGFEESFGWRDFVLNAFVAYAVAFIASAAVLGLFAVLGADMSLDEMIGKVTLQAIPGSIGAMLARSQLGGAEPEEERRRETYGGELFIAAVGALFMAFNVAPTEEIALIAFIMTKWHAMALVVVSLLLMHAFVYAVQFRGQTPLREVSPWSEFLRLTVVSYVIALVISAYILWTFGRTEGLAPEEVLTLVVVLGFPAAIGAAAARLIL